MAKKKYILRSFKPGKKEHNKINTLINLSSLGLNAQQSIIKNSLSLGASETSLFSNSLNSLYPYEEDNSAVEFNKYKDITKNSNDSYAFYDLSYPQRVEYLRLFAQLQTISFVLDTIADESIILDENNYFAHLDTDKLKMNISSGSELGDKLIETCDKAFKRVYSMFGWDRSNGAWNMFKKFLIEGYLSYEIIYDNLDNPREIIGFKYIDPITLEPGILMTPDGKEVKVWYQNKGDSEQRVIPDTNMIYISWHSGEMGDNSRISYLEGLTRTYNMMTQIENSHIIWNVLNAQKRIKVIVPVNDLSPYKADTLMNEIKSEWNEETHIDSLSGEVVVNGNPNFSFTKTYFFPLRTNGTMTIEEIATEGYDMSNTESMKYWWRRFILETKVPANRFMIDPAADGAHLIGSADDVTREEYAFSRFINRIRAIFREILLKPVWILVCLYMPLLAKSEYLKQAIGVVFNEENLFASAKYRSSLLSGVNIIQQLYGLQDLSGKPVFSMNFLVERFLDFTEDDIALNKKYKEREILEQLEQAKRMKQHQQYNAENGGGQNGMAQGNDDFGGAGGGFGGDDFGGGFGDDFGTGAGDDFGGGGDDFGSAGGGDDFGAADAGGGDAGGDMGM